MSASPIPDSACPSCGEEVAPGARFCAGCGAPTGDRPAFETVPEPVVVHEVVERGRLGTPARFVLLWLGFAALGASVGLFATTSWVWAVVFLLLAVALLAALAEAMRDGADGVRVATAVEVSRTRLDASVSRRRPRSRQGDEAAEQSARRRLVGAGERIRRARLAVQETIMVTPNEPHPPYPPPDEGNPPEPAQVPEPYPPPDEGTPPAPEPYPSETERE